MGKKKPADKEPKYQLYVEQITSGSPSFGRIGDIRFGIKDVNYALDDSKEAEFIKATRAQIERSIEAIRKRCPNPESISLEIRVEERDKYSRPKITFEFPYRGESVKLRVRELDIETGKEGEEFDLTLPASGDLPLTRLFSPNHVALTRVLIDLISGDLLAVDSLKENSNLGNDLPGLKRIVDSILPPAKRWVSNVDASPAVSRVEIKEVGIAVLFNLADRETLKTVKQLGIQMESFTLDDNKRFTPDDTLPITRTITELKNRINRTLIRSTGIFIDALKDVEVGNNANGVLSNKISTRAPAYELRDTFSGLPRVFTPDQYTCGYIPLDVLTPGRASEILGLTLRRLVEQGHLRAVDISHELGDLPHVSTIGKLPARGLGSDGIEIV